jgi:hypothetical protein
MIELDKIELRNHGYDWARISATASQDIATIHRDLVYGAYYVQGGIMYISDPHPSGLASFKVQTENRMGYGGAHIPITMRDGTTVTLVGPWSSREGVANQLTGRKLVDIAINSLAVSIDLSALQPQLTDRNPNWVLERKIDNQGEITYSVPAKHAPPQGESLRNVNYSI